MRRAAALLLLVASVALSCVEKNSRRYKREDLLVRSKRRWVLSTIEITEEDPGPFPKQISQMYNDQLDKVAKHKFVISGSGVTDPPMGVFSIDETNGTVFALKPVDRESYSCFHIKFDILDKNTNVKLDKELSFDVAIKDINDNAPRFFKPRVIALVNESHDEGFLPVQLQATDQDEPNSENSTIKFTMVSQTPQEPKIELEQMDPRMAQLKYSGCFDYDKTKRYDIIVRAEDGGKPALSSTASITLKILDTNTHLPTFKDAQYSGEINENEVKDEILRLAVEDKDTPNTPAWRAKYIIKGNEEGLYKIVTDPKTNEGIFSVVKGKDYVTTTVIQIQIEVVNEESYFHCKYKPDPAPKPNSINISLTVVDMNDPPVFENPITNIHQKEEDPPGKVLYTPKVTDDDSDLSKIRFVLLDEPAGWMKIDPKTGQVSTAKKLDRESPFVDRNNVYTVIVGAIDDGKPEATGTGTILIHLKDINDHKPKLVNSSAIFCTNMGSIPVRVEDLDAAPYSAPFSFALDDSDSKLKEYWKLDPTFGNASTLSMEKTLALGNYSIPLLLEDQQNMKNTETLSVVVCECGQTNTCLKQPLTVDMGGAAIGLIVGSLLLFLLLLLAIACHCGRHFQKLPHAYIDEGNQTLIKYNQEGGSSECKAEPSMFLMTTTNTTTNNITVTDSQKMLQPMISTFTEETRVQDNYEEEMGTMYQGGMRSNGMYSFDTWGNRGSLYRGTSRYSRYSLQVNQHISEHLQKKLHLLSGGQAEDVGYHPHEYAYEGNGSRSQSLDQLSMGNLDDLQFLDDLGPKFKTLGGICQNGIEQKNIRF
ncbi:cadherin-like protein 26 [Periophthalmus magnuspinnatus]|uniref:cadherin-like protein 26 n=1 Tax=Periophthalmus magnuspinnatus TaxID=409849 RepID=UPI0024370CA1|nr:cadherin-like protein 26 [Periophthalmus magnuspinnatus]